MRGRAPQGGREMKTLLKNGIVIDVFTGEKRPADVLIDGGRIAGVGRYAADDADTVRDVGGRYLCPGFIDGHIHIESTMLTPAEFANACVPHGTTSVVADPHEIANVCGAAGIRYMLSAGDGLPLTVYVVLPSCVPATPFCESGARLEAADLRPFYRHPRVLGLGEVMNYAGVVGRDKALLEKIRDALRRGRVVNGHAPLLSGRALDAYIAAGIGDDHECTSADEAFERIRKGQCVMIRQGTAAKNLGALLPLFDEPWARRCMLVSDDKHPADLLREGHIDAIIRQAAAAGKDPVTGIRMATLQAAEHFGLKKVGAVAPGYDADILILDDLPSVSVAEVFCKGRRVAAGGRMLSPAIARPVPDEVRDTFRMQRLTETDFALPYTGRRLCRVIRIGRNGLFTEERHETIDFDTAGGIDTGRDILKIAVIERHAGTGHKGLGFVSGTGLRRGAIASSVSHDSHNLIVIGADEKDMAAAGNRVLSLGGGLVTACDGEIVAEMPLPVAGLMTELPAAAAARQNEAVRDSARALCAAGAELFMTAAFVSLPVIPHLRLTTKGLADTDLRTLVPLTAD